MKTHKSRWYRNSPTSWILKEPVKDGSAVLATIRDAVNGVHWLAEIGTERILCGSRQEAQRAVREALREGVQEGVQS